MRGARCVWEGKIWGGGGRRSARIDMVSKYQRKFVWRLLSAWSCPWAQEEVLKDCVARDLRFRRVDNEHMYTLCAGV